MKKLIFIPLFVLLDFITKYLFKEKAVMNTGIAFGLFEGNNFLWIIVSLIVIGVLIYYYKKEKDIRLALMLILSGAVGNLIDRILYNGVIDFIDFGFWPAFNLADAYNTIGVVMILWIWWKK